MASSRAKSHGYGFQRSISPGGRFVSSATRSQSSSSFCSTSAAFSSPPAGFFTRSASPTRVNVVASAPSVRFSLDRARSPSRSLSRLPVSSQRSGVVKKQNNLSSPAPRKTCMCSPTNHPGSFRCSLHKNTGSPSNRLDARRSSMTNSLVRIGTVEGEWVRRALITLIRPSSHQQRRRAAFRPRPSRLSNMSKAGE
ncbi:uncharacterized protein LOC116253554 [Nymphaea colorata]|uniref:uncharacterized protein LOC116253554 n=1 Tax=Nymphaea colorata TaxID=210225 RepID=UPI00129E19D4|nr:uncharacterized protein LOC116253554 [Nymphaea colorata]XP_049933633.1 uncharacterized protein LOC116253554 [Nymphaea colorata]